MAMVREFGHEGFADYIQQGSLQEAFINTLKMEPHYEAGYMAAPMAFWMLKVWRLPMTSIT